MDGQTAMGTFKCPLSPIFVNLYSINIQLYGICFVYKKNRCMFSEPAVQCGKLCPGICFPW